MIRRGILKRFDSASATATVQIAGSLSVWLEGLAVSRGIPSAEMTAGRAVAVVFFDQGNPEDAVVVGVWE